MPYSNNYNNNVTGLPFGWLNIALRLIFYVFLQALFLRHMRLLGIAMPLLYIYFIISLPRNTPRWLHVTLSAFMGLLVDMFCNTPGISMAPLILIGMIKPYYLEWYMRNEDPSTLIPSTQTMGQMRFFAYTLALTLIFCFTMFTLEALTLFNFWRWLGSIILSTALTIALIFVIDYMKKPSSKR